MTFLICKDDRNRQVWVYEYDDVDQAREGETQIQAIERFETQVCITRFRNRLGPLHPEMFPDGYQVHHRDGRLGIAA